MLWRDDSLIKQFVNLDKLATRLNCDFCLASLAVAYLLTQLRARLRTRIDL